MAEGVGKALSRLLAEEYRAAKAAADAGRSDEAWHHLERAHILAQTRFWPHCQSHLRLLKYAVRLCDWREAGGQIARLALAPLGNLMGRLPIGNTGRTNVSAFAPMTVPPDLKALLDPAMD